jgi:hypothetical protein
VPYTFGGATTDDITATTGVTVGSGGGVFCAGWWYPTTLTATRGLWAMQTTMGAEINTTTSELRLRTNNTTDGQHTTTGAGLVVNEWRFLAFWWYGNNTGPNSQWSVWSGNLNTPPAACTITVATAPAGNFTGASTFYVGNMATASQAFQGDVAEVLFLNHANQSGDETLTTFGLPNTTAAPTAAITANIYNRFVLPCWQGDYGIVINGLTRSAWTSSYYPLDGPIMHLRVGNSGVAPVSTPVAPTVNGATLSARRAPREVTRSFVHRPRPLSSNL